VAACGSDATCHTNQMITENLQKATRANLTAMYTDAMDEKTTTKGGQREWKIKIASHIKMPEIKSF
jgi:hypothetical protein